MTLKILYIEDNAFNMRLGKKMIEMSGYEMVGAEDGFSGLEMVKQENPDVILLDMNLPDIDGMEILERLRSDQKFNTPVIALTANAMYGDKERFMDGGCDGYISKPINRQELVALIEEFTSNTTTKFKL